MGSELQSRWLFHLLCNKNRSPLAHETVRKLSLLFFLKKKYQKSYNNTETNTLLPGKFPAGSFIKLVLLSDETATDVEVFSCNFSSRPACIRLTNRRKPGQL